MTGFKHNWFAVVGMVFIMVVFLPQGMRLPGAQAKSIAAVDGINKSQPASPKLAQALGWIQLLHTSMIGSVNAIAFVGNDMYIGGNFSFIPDGAVTPLHNIAKYSGGVWSALANNGLDGNVYAFAVAGTDLYVGGSFSNSDDFQVTNIVSIARYDTVAKSWSGLPHQGLGGYVFALAYMGNDLYVGGTFSGTADGGVLNLHGIAKYSNSQWIELANKGLEGEVHALAVIGNNLYVGGSFAETYDVKVKDLNNIARYSGGAWSALANTGLDTVVNALAVNGTDLYVGGIFTKTKDNTITGLHHIAKFNSNGWSALSHNGVNGLSIRVLTVNGTDLYIGGSFSATFDGGVIHINNIAKYDLLNATWAAMPKTGLSSEVDAISASGSNLYVGGLFAGTGDGLQYLGQIVKLGSVDSKLYIPLVKK